MSVRLVNLAQREKRERERERERERWSESPKKRKSLFCLLESRVLAEVCSPSFGVHLICMNIYLYWEKRRRDLSATPP
jgi:hypothetical protein